MYFVKYCKAAILMNTVWYFTYQYYKPVHVTLQGHSPVVLLQTALLLPLTLQLHRLQPEDEKPVKVSRQPSHLLPTTPYLQLERKADKSVKCIGFSIQTIEVDDFRMGRLFFTVNFLTCKSILSNRS